jgi:hypothetical protein
LAVRLIPEAPGPLGFSTVAVDVIRHSYRHGPPTSGPASVPDQTTHLFTGGVQVLLTPIADDRSGSNVGSPGYGTVPG